jgi:hypothetical protein
MRMRTYKCHSCGKEWRQEHHFKPESCVYCGALVADAEPVLDPIVPKQENGSESEALSR